jgi:hypothetical protein
MRELLGRKRLITLQAKWRLGRSIPDRRGRNWILLDQKPLAEICAHVIAGLTRKMAGRDSTVRTNAPYRSFDRNGRKPY